jgi:hypothetical protein
MHFPNACVCAVLKIYKKPICDACFIHLKCLYRPQRHENMHVTVTQIVCGKGSVHGDRRKYSYALSVNPTKKEKT